jgi:hypothetical protein
MRDELLQWRLLHIQGDPGRLAIELLQATTQRSGLSLVSTGSSLAAGDQGKWNSAQWSFKLSGFFDRINIDFSSEGEFKGGVCQATYLKKSVV